MEKEKLFDNIGYLIKNKESFEDEEISSYISDICDDINSGEVERKLIELERILTEGESESEVGEHQILMELVFLVDDGLISEEECEVKK